MSTTYAVTNTPGEVTEANLVRTARTTGVFYLAFFIFGILGSMVVPAQLFVDGDPQGTLSNLADHEWLARVGIALELGIVLTQALTAVWFFRLFRRVDAFAAGSLALFGMVNAVAILGSAALMATALDVAHDHSLAVAGGTASTVQLLYVASNHLWGVAGVFFGLWLIPMGWLVIRSRWLPRILGWLLVVGGVAYALGTFIAYLLSGADAVSQLFTIPATIGELWIMGYLLVVGVHTDTGPGVRAPAAPRSTGPSQGSGL